MQACLRVGDVIDALHLYQRKDPKRRVLRRFTVEKIFLMVYSTIYMKRPTVLGERFPCMLLSTLEANQASKQIS